MEESGLDFNKPAELEDLNQKQRKIWNNISKFWDSQMVEGNTFQRVLVGPSTERLVDLQSGERVLEIGCGNGVMARRLAQLHSHQVKILATDFSVDFIQCAKDRTPVDTYTSIEYKVIDATDTKGLLDLRTANGAFDVIVCNMAMMDMATIDPLLEAVPRLLQGSAKGRFVFSVMHPCFNGADCEKSVCETTQGTELKTVCSVKVSKYLQVSPELGLGMPGQPELHYYFHRPLHVLLGSCFRAGLVMDGIEEPSFQPGTADAEESDDMLSWTNFTQIPPILTLRMRPVMAAS